jgi:hypothetical protein
MKLIQETKELKAAIEASGARCTFDNGELIFVDIIGGAIWHNGKTYMKNFRDQDSEITIRDVLVEISLDISVIDHTMSQYLKSDI